MVICRRLFLSCFVSLVLYLTIRLSGDYVIDVYEYEELCGGNPSSGKHKLTLRTVECAERLVAEASGEPIHSAPLYSRFDKYSISRKIVRSDCAADLPLESLSQKLEAFNKAVSYTTTEKLYALRFGC